MSGMEEYLRETPLMNFSNPRIQALLSGRGWRRLCAYDRIGAAYNFVRDEIAFGYNADDALPASRVLADGYGQCNTKGVLLMALFRALEIPCRIHGFTIDKRLQRGAMTGLVYRSAPKNILHSWVEAYSNGRWLELEGFILDRAYLTELQRLHSGCAGAFCGYGAAVKDFRNPPIDWNGGNTYIQSEGITQDLGAYPAPDALFAAHRQPLSPFKGVLYRHLGRRLMNRNIRRIRGAG